MSRWWQGPCAVCHERTTRYGDNGDPLCDSCRVIVDQRRAAARVTSNGG